VTRKAPSTCSESWRVAYSLLNDRRLAIAYEPYASSKRRGPDYAVTYRANLVFNIKVARIRVEENEAGGLDLSRREERILRILRYKLGHILSTGETPVVPAGAALGEFAGQVMQYLDCAR